MLAEAEQLARTEVDRKMPANIVAKLLNARLDGEHAAKILRPALFPEDDDV